eukprot:2177853-Amphidinium_carterae.2
MSAPSMMMAICPQASFVERLRTSNLNRAVDCLVVGILHQSQFAWRMQAVRLLHIHEERSTAWLCPICLRRIAGGLVGQPQRIA